MHSWSWKQDREWQRTKKGEILYEETQNVQKERSIISEKIKYL
jgi:hypothetical protein